MPFTPRTVLLCSITAAFCVFTASAPEIPVAAPVAAALPAPAQPPLVVPSVSMIKQADPSRTSPYFINPEDVSCVRRALPLPPELAAEVLRAGAAWGPRQNHDAQAKGRQRNPAATKQTKVPAEQTKPAVVTMGGAGAITEVCFSGARSIFLADSPEDVAANLQIPVKLTTNTGEPVWINPAYVAGVGFALPGYAPQPTNTQIDINDGTQFWAKEGVDEVAHDMHLTAKFTTPGGHVLYVNPVWVAYARTPEKEFTGWTKGANTQIMVGTPRPQYFVTEPLEEVAEKIKAAGAPQ